MTRALQILCLAMVAASAPAPAQAQRVHEVRLERVGEGADFRFRPAEVRVAPGEIVEFVVVSGGPYVIGFEAGDLRPRDRAALDAAIPDRSAELRTSVLRGPGSRLRLVVPDLEKGTYRFTALTHIAYRMTGRLVLP